jgi:NADH dehydrogenase FAD-containing subunit
MRKRGADVRFNQAVGRHDPPEADVLLWCIGYKAEPSYLGARAIPVDAHLRVEGRLNVFAVGDITALPEPKLGIHAGKHAAVAIENLRRLMRNPHARLATYRPATGSRTMLVTLGRRHGTGHLPIGDFTNSWFARKVKSGDMFIGRYRNGIGLKRTLAAPANAFA